MSTFGILTTAFLAALIHIGIGQLVGRWLLSQRTVPLAAAFWMGLGAIIAFLQLWHLVLPISWGATLVLSTTGVLGLWKVRGSTFSHPRWIWLIVGGITLLLIGNNGLDAPIFYDNGLYHFQSIRWAESYPVVPGLGNLHGRLAFNSSYFLYVAWLNYMVPGIAGFRVANGLLTTVLLLEAIGVLAVSFRNRHWSPYSLMAVLLPIPILYTAFDPLAAYLASPTSDFFVFILTLKIGWTLLQFLEPAEDNITNGWVLIILSPVLIVIKLSGGVFAAFIIVLVSLSLVGRYKQRNRSLLSLGAGIATTVACVFVPWLYRNVILSGYLVYPGTELSFPVEWRIPVAQALDDVRWVQAWSRRPEVGVHWSETLQNWDWLAGWQVNFWRTRGIRLSIVLAGVSWGVTLLSTLLLRRVTPTVKTMVLWSLSSGLALIVWFVSAPDPRFALAYFWFIALGGCVAAIASIPVLNPLVVRILAFRLSEWGIAAGIVGLLLVSHGLTWNTEAAPIPTAQVQGYTTSSGLMVYIPKDGSELCWNAPLPCTPYPRPALRLRDPNDLGSGFIQK